MTVHNIIAQSVYLGKPRRSRATWQGIALRVILLCGDDIRSDESIEKKTC